MKKLVKILLPLIDVMIVFFVYPSAWLLKNVRRVGVHRLPYCKNALMNVGVFPIREHYYEPQFKFDSPQSVTRSRVLAGIELNVDEQLEMLTELKFADEFEKVIHKHEGSTVPGFQFANKSFESGDAEYWYQIIRAKKPKNIYEIGSGNSTLIARKAIAKNKEDDSDYDCNHVCVEPYEMPWLEETGVTVLRERIEKLGVERFSDLSANDILFIDSSHIIRPQGDVVFEYLELLPTLSDGVIVHIHDIFTPKNYLKKWLVDEVRFWNEQYLLEAFLSHNTTWRIIGALNYLHYHHYDKLSAVAPFLLPEREPGSFYIQKNSQ